MTSTEIRKKFANNVQALRKSRGLSRNEAAKMMGISYTYMCQIENEKEMKNVSNELLSKLTELFGIDVYILYK